MFASKFISLLGTFVCPEPQERTQNFVQHWAMHYSPDHTLAVKLALWLTLLWRLMWHLHVQAYVLQQQRRKGQIFMKQSYEEIFILCNFSFSHFNIKPQKLHNFCKSFKCCSPLPKISHQISKLHCKLSSQNLFDRSIAVKLNIKKKKEYLGA